MRSLRLDDGAHHLAGILLIRSNPGGKPLRIFLKEERNIVGQQKQIYIELLRERFCGRQELLDNRPVLRFIDGHIDTHIQRGAVSGVIDGDAVVVQLTEEGPKILRALRPRNLKVLLQFHIVQLINPGHEFLFVRSHRYSAVKHRVLTFLGIKQGIEIAVSLRIAILDGIPLQLLKKAPGFITEHDMCCVPHL